MSMTLDARSPAPRNPAPRSPARGPARKAGAGGFAPLVWLKRRFRARPGATLMHGAFAAAGLAIVVNAVVWQPAPQRALAPEPQATARAAPPVPPQRPSDLAAMPASAPRVAPAPPVAQPQQAAQARPAGTSRESARETAREPQREAARDGARDQIGDLIRTGMVPGMETPRPPAAVIERASMTSGGDRPVLAAQRALNKIGIGPVRADGRFGEETRAAIERFERERRIPVTRDLSPRTLRELAAASGIRME